jgi:hypothetical protein
MSYLKPYNYVDGAQLAASDQLNNDDTLKKAIDQDTVAADLASGAFNRSDWSRGELDPINNAHQFETGGIMGLFNDADGRFRSYFTSHTKVGDDTQTSANAKQYQAVYELGDQVVIEHTADVLFTAGINFVCFANDVVPRGQWDSRVYLMVTSATSGTPTIVQGTRSYIYEETVTHVSAGTTVPGGYDHPGVPLPKDQGQQNRRWVGFQWHLTGLAPGTYRFYVAVNSKVEQGFAGSRSYTMELFY